LLLGDPPRRRRQEWIPLHGQGRIWTLFSTANVTMISPTVGARIPPELHHQLLEAAARLQVTPSEVIVAALRQYLERLQTPVNNPAAAGIQGFRPADVIDRLEQLERRVEALESAVRVSGTESNHHRVTEQQCPVDPPADLDALSVMELRRLARRVIGPGGDRDPTTGRHLRRADLLAELQRMLGRA